MMPVRSLRACVAALLAAGLAHVPRGQADPLPKDACEAVAVEHAKLTEAGVPELVKKGPDWVRTTLGEARMLEVARFIGLQEAMLFRCGFDKAKALPGNRGDEASDDRTAAVSAPPLPQRKPRVPEGFKTRPISAATKGSAKGAGPAARPQPKAARKPKADDAYRPPPRVPDPR